MKIIINIEKKHLYFLSILLILILSGVVIAENHGANVLHSNLVTDKIESYNNNEIEIADPIKGSNNGITVKDNLDVEKKLTVKGDLEVNDGIVGARIDCRQDSCGAKVIDVFGGMPYGGWAPITDCSPGFYVCGLEQRVENWKSEQDDTSVNDIRLHCCPF